MYSNNSQKVNISSNCVYNTGHFIYFFPKKNIFSSKCACISSTILTFLPNNPVCFYTKNYQKVHFSINCDIIIQSSKCVCRSSMILTIFPNNSLCFTPKIPKKFIFTLIVYIIQGTLLTFLPKQVIFSSKCACISSTILTFLPNNQVCFYTKSPKKLIFPQIATIIQGTLLTFLPKKVNLFSKCACICSKNPIKSGIF